MVKKRILRCLLIAPSKVFEFLAYYFDYVTINIKRLTKSTPVNKIFKAINEKNGILILTSDHGNSETMWDEVKKSKHTAHTNNLVPFILVNGGDDIKLNKGRLSDIAPTIIQLLNIDKPKEIEGKSLII